jgi:hypothetical protein
VSQLSDPYQSDLCRDNPARCYHHNEMKPQTLGRALGIGLRVAGRVAGQRLSAQAIAAPAQAAAQPQPPRKAAPTADAVRKGVGGFFKPFRHVGGIVFLEVMGVFFLLFVLIFSQATWRMRASYAAGPDHSKFLISAVLAVVFLYLSLSSFWRARKR